MNCYDIFIKLCLFLSLIINSNNELYVSKMFLFSDKHVGRLVLYVGVALPELVFGQIFFLLKQTTSFNKISLIALHIFASQYVQNLVTKSFIFCEVYLGNSAFSS